MRLPALAPQANGYGLGVGGAWVWLERNSQIRQPTAASRHPNSYRIHKFGACGLVEQ